MLKHYLSLTKPGIIFGNLVAAAAGFFLAAKGEIDWTLFTVTMLGVALIVASGCTFNNYIDRDIDGKMQRTKNRVLVTGIIPVSNALTFAVILGLIGFSLTLFYSNLLVFAFGALGFVVYVGFYSLKYKRTSVYSTAIGSLSGACPPVMGYVAVVGQVDVGAIILLVAFCLWQIPHSYAIAIYRFNDYQQAKIPVLPIKEGIKSARYHIIAYTFAFVLIALMLTQQNYAGMLYAAVMTALGLYWAYIAMIEYSKMDEQAWGRKMFVLSIVTIICFSVLISIDFVTEESAVLSNQS